MLPTRSITPNSKYVFSLAVSLSSFRFTNIDQLIQAYKAKDAVLFEQFLPETASKWKASNAVKAGTDGEFSYVGKWEIEEPTVFPGFKGDKGLVVKSPAAHHAISTLLEEPLDNKGKTLVLQYEVKLQESLECGGAYIKLLSENEDLHNKEFSNESPYQVMFGPDKCGSTNKVHFIIRRKNPITGEYEEKHLKNPAPARLNKSTNLYTLIIKEDQDFEIRINGKVVRAGNLLDEGVMNPSINPPKEIDDPNDVKPEDWIDDVYIPDPEQATKPEDWDEDQPLKIPDPEATKPADWDEDVPEYIPDPDTEVPEDWDEEEDGEFVAPEISNPECELHGCGPWKAPMIPNPKYKGKWAQPQIRNPDYIGAWAPKKIPNPDYYEDATPSDLEPIGGLGFEIWTMQKNILFDNIYLGHSIEEAESIGNFTFVPKLVIEQKQENAKIKQVKAEQKKQMYGSMLDHFREDPVDFATELYKTFMININADPVKFLREQPVIFIGCVLAFFVVSALGMGVLSVFAYLLKSLFSSSQAPTKEQKEKKEALDKKIQEYSAKSSSTASETAPTKRSKTAE
ncbi:hypothetical protein D0Z03_001779 [Geotrichum reessii]|nr:hypothetical protein D0Z03_001779 [Galactomyces reessii]